MRQRVCGRVGEPAAACLRESLPPRESASANVSCGRIRVEKRDLIKLDPPAGDTYGTVQADAAVSEPNSGRDRTLLRHGSVRSRPLLGAGVRRRPLFGGRCPKATTVRRPESPAAQTTG